MLGKKGNPRKLTNNPEFGKGKLNGIRN